MIRALPDNPLYGATRDGRVFRIVRSHDRGRHVPFEMKLRKDADGYLVCGGSKNTLKAHRAVASAWVPNPNNLPEVRHRDGVRSHNWAENLEWGERQDNIDDMVRHGTRQRGTNWHRSKLTEEMVLEARRRAAQGESHTDLAQEFPVDRSVLSRAIRKETWTHV